MQTHSASPARIAPAATVILTREEAGRIQVYLLKRSLKSGFMAGTFVFPGGMVCREDKNYDILSRHCDLSPGEISGRFGPELSVDEALAYCSAAIRETFEEAGVFLADQPTPATTGLQKACALRLAVDLKADWFLNLVVKGKWRLAFSRLSCWSHWVTPELMERRYDTRFFLAEMPPEQLCRPDERETVQGLWLNPQDALVRNLAGQIPLSPPTLVTLQQLSKYTGLRALQTEARHRRWGPAIMPRLIPLTNGAVIVEPWDPMYHQREICIDLDHLPASVLQAGEAFSRIWLDQGIWKPIGLRRRH